MLTGCACHVMRGFVQSTVPFLRVSLALEECEHAPLVGLCFQILEAPCYRMNVVCLVPRRDWRGSPLQWFYLGKRESYSSFEEEDSQDEGTAILLGCSKEDAATFRAFAQFWRCAVCMLYLVTFWIVILSATPGGSPHTFCRFLRVLLSFPGLLS